MILWCVAAPTFIKACHESPHPIQHFRIRRQINTLIADRSLHLICLMVTMSVECNELVQMKRMKPVILTTNHCLRTGMQIPMWSAPMRDFSIDQNPWLWLMMDEFWYLYRSLPVHQEGVFFLWQSCVAFEYQQHVGIKLRLISKKKTVVFFDVIFIH